MTISVEHLRRECERRGIRIERAGVAWRLIGPGVNLLAADLKQLDERDLTPVKFDAQSANERT